MPGGREQRDAGWRAVGAHRRRHREPAQIEQVDEIGVGAEPAVELDRIGQHLLDGVDRRHGRQHQRVDRAEDVVAHAAQFLELVERREGIGRGRARAVEDDRARHRMDRVRRRREQRADREIALGEPWAFVEQPRGLVERLDVDLGDGGAELGEPRQRVLVGLRRLAVAEEHALAGERHAEPHAARHRLRSTPSGCGARIGIGGVGAGHGGERRHRVVDREREHRHAIERAAGRHDARGRDQPEARLQPDDVVERRRARGRSRRCRCRARAAPGPPPPPPPSRSSIRPE